MVMTEKMAVAFSLAEHGPKVFNYKLEPADVNFEPYFVILGRGSTDTPEQARQRAGVVADLLSLEVVDE
jgi:hypothetical protein